MKKTPETLKTLIDCVQDGLTNEDACMVAGIHKDTFYTWIKEDADFSDAINKARIFRKRYHLDRIHKAGREDWRASSWYLAHAYPDQFSEKRITEIQGELKSPYELILEAIEKREQEEDSEDSN